MVTGATRRTFDKLDSWYAHFNRGAPGPTAKPPAKDRVSSLFENYEKVLAFMLAAANITLSDGHLNTKKRANASRDAGWPFLLQRRNERRR